MNHQNEAGIASHAKDGDNDQQPKKQWDDSKTPQFLLDTPSNKDLGRVSFEKQNTSQLPKNLTGQAKNQNSLQRPERSVRNQRHSQTIEPIEKRHQPVYQSQVNINAGAKRVESALARNSQRFENASLSQEWLRDKNTNVGSLPKGKAGSMCNFEHQSDCADEHPIIKGSNNIQDSGKKSDQITLRIPGKKITQSVIVQDKSNIELGVTNLSTTQKNRELAAQVKSNERARLKKKDDENQNKFKELMQKDWNREFFTLNKNLRQVEKSVKEAQRIKKDPANYFRSKKASPSRHKVGQKVQFQLPDIQNIP